MKYLMIACALMLPAYGATLTVCAGCTYTTAQAALNASNNGDTIVLTAGQNFGDLTIPGGRHDLTIKSSAIDGYPRGYRITRNNPALARLTSVTMGDFQHWGTATPGTATLTNAPNGGSVTPHGYQVGDKLVISGTRYSTYLCASVNQPPYVDGACDASRVGYFNIRFDTHLANGSILSFRGRTLPPPLQQNTLYYIVNFVRGGSSYNADKFMVSLTPGGTPVVVPQFDPAGQDLVVEVPPYPRTIGDTLFVAATPTPTTLQLSATPNGPPIVWSQIPWGYNGGGYSFGFNLYKSNPTYNITLDGIEVAPLVDNGQYFTVYVQAYIGSLEGEHHDLKFLRCWDHGADDQQDFPQANLSIAARDVEVGWSVLENAYSTIVDSQAIHITSTRNFWIHDNEIKGATEGILSGGSIPWFAYLTNTTGITVSRNYLWKPMKAYIGIAAVYLSPTQFQFLSRPNGSDCSAVAGAANLGLRCFAYESQESNPATAVVSRTEWNANAANSTFTATGTTGQSGFIYLLGGVFHMDYNFSGSVTCPSGVACTYTANPSFPSLSTRIGIEIVGTDGDNVFDSDTFFAENRNVWSKNLLESKYGDNWLIEGNVFHRQDDCDGGSTCQDPAIQFTNGSNGSGPADPVDYLVSSSYSIIRNNIFRHMTAGIVGVGKTFAGNFQGTGLTWEYGGFGRSIAVRVENNLFMDLGSTEYSEIFLGAMLRHQSTESWLIQHNTAVDIRIGVWADNNVQGSLIRSNILTPYRSACPGITTCLTPAATSNIGVMDQPGPPPIPYFGGAGANSWAGAISNGNIDTTSSFDNNLVMNRPGYTYYTTRGKDYPSTTWQIQPSDPGRDPSSLFTTWVERSNSVPPNGLNYRASNYRLAPGQAALYPAYDDRVIGADIDEIEALTGKNGVDVENGWPRFSDRVARTISVGTTSAVISYLSNGSSCTLEVWPNSSYSGTPTINVTDGGAVALGGMVTVSLPGLTLATPYYGKRWCGTEVDVFSFTTLSASSTLAVRLRATGGATSCVVDYGNTAALGSVTDVMPVVSGICEVTVPASAVYWRYDYRSAAGTTVALGDTQRRGQ